MHHRNSPSTPVGRQRAVAQVIDRDRPIAHIASVVTDPATPLLDVFAQTARRRAGSVPATSPARHPRHRGRSRDPLYGILRGLRTGADLLADRQCDRLTSVFAGDGHAAVEATWGIYQRIVEAYRNPDRAAAKQQHTAMFKDLASDVPSSLAGIITLGRTPKRRADDVLAYFDQPGTSNGPTEATNGRLEHLRGTALGFRNLTHYILGSLLDAGGFRPLLHPQMR